MKSNELLKRREQLMRKLNRLQSHIQVGIGYGYWYNNDNLAELREWMQKIIYKMNTILTWKK